MNLGHNRHSIVSISAFLALVLIGCSPASPKLVEKSFRVFEKVHDDREMSAAFNNQVDILMVIDDSGSMQEKQQNIVKNMDLFLQAMQNTRDLDFHIGVITTTLKQNEVGSSGAWGGHLVANPTVIDRNTPNFSDTLRNHIMVGTSGSGTEQHFLVTQAALSPPVVNNENAGFLRPDAYLAIISVSDAEAQDGDPHSFYKFLLNLKNGDQSKILFYAAYIPTTDNTCSRSGEDPPVAYEVFFKLIKAKTFGLCDPDFGGKLASFGADLSNSVGGTVLLSRPPDVSSIVVTYGSQIISNDALTGWSYEPERNAVVLGKSLKLTQQPIGTKISINFLAAEYD